MVTEADKYRAQFLQIVGLACMTPMGKIFLDIPNVDIQYMSIKHFLYLIVCLFLAYVGIMIAVRGLEILEEK